VTDVQTGAPLAEAVVIVEIEQQGSYTFGNLRVSSVLTGAGGEYSLTVAPGRYSRIRTSGPSGHAGEIVDDVVFSGASATQNFAHRSFSSFPVRVTGRVMNGGTVVPVSTGGHLSRSCLTVTGATCRTEFFSGNPDGSFTLLGDPDKYDLYVRSSAGGFGVNSIRTTFLDATTATSFTGIDVPVSTTTTIVRGLVTDSVSGAPVADAEVFLRIPQRGHSSGGEARIALTRTDSFGHYALPGAPGPYTLRVEKDGYRSGRSAVELSGTSLLRNVALRPLSSFPVTITGRVLNGTTPVAGVFLSSQCRTVQGASCATASAGASAADGSYRIHAEAGRVDIWLQSSSGGAGVNSTATAFADATTGTTFSGINVQVAPSTTHLSGRVKDARTGAAIAGAEVALSVPAQGGGAVRIAFNTTDETGHYQLPVAAGIYTAEAARAGYAAQSRSLPASGAALTQDFALAVADTTTPTPTGTPATPTGTPSTAIPTATPPPATATGTPPPPTATATPTPTGATPTPTPGSVGGSRFSLTSRTGGVAFLRWEGGTAQRSYVVLRFASRAADSFSLPASAVSHVDTPPSSEVFWCYQLLALGELAPLSASDTLCFVPRFASGRSPTDFTLSLERGVAHFSWTPPGGQFAYLLLALGTGRTYTLPATTTSADDPIGPMATCYILIAVGGGAPGLTDVLCGVPGQPGGPAARPSVRALGKASEPPGADGRTLGPPEALA
jgi:hypothetical protein